MKLAFLSAASLAALLVVNPSAFASGAIANKPITVTRSLHIAADPSTSARGSALDPLDAPMAGSVYKPADRDAGNFAAARWATVRAQTSRLGDNPYSARQVSGPRRADRDAVHYDSFGAFLSTVFR
jgi:hypothetical protein